MSSAESSRSPALLPAGRGISREAAGCLDRATCKWRPEGISGWREIPHPAEERRVSG
jgi:hypothetical protein